jgi:uncharacterized protein (DUF849 family)
MPITSHRTIITCAVTGAAPITDRSAAVPVTPRQIADECLSAARAGAAIVHIHARDPETGAPSMKMELYREIVDRVRSGGVDVIVNLTTGAGARFVPNDVDPRVAGPGSTLAPPEERVRHVVALKPDMCSLDIATMNFGRNALVNIPDHIRIMAKAIREAGVKPELEVFDIGHIWLARRMIADGDLDGPGFFQICLGVPGGSPASPEALLDLFRHLPADVGWSAFGIAAQSFRMVAQSLMLGGHVRVGLEDNLYVSRGKPASGNAELLEKAVRIIGELGGEVASPADARAILQLARR